MLRPGFRVFVVSLAFAALPALAAAAPVPAQSNTGVAPGEAVPAPEGSAAAPQGEFVYGPILAKDPEVRVQIKKLYRDMHDLQVATQTQLDELVVALQNEADPDFRFQIQKDMIAAKKAMQIQSVEIGLEIAKLNEDTARVLDYEKALDQLLHPEKYMPAVDPSKGTERAQAMGLEK